MHRPARYRRRDLVDYDWVWPRRQSERTVPAVAGITVGPRLPVVPNEPNNTGPAAGRSRAARARFAADGSDQQAVSSDDAPPGSARRARDGDRVEAAPRVTAGADRDRFLDTLAGLVRRLKPAARVLEWPDGDSLCDPVWAERPDLEVVFVSDRAGSAGRLASQHPHWTVLSHATPGAIVGSGFRLMVIGSERFRREHADRRFQMADWLARTGVILIPAFARTAETSFRRVRMMTPGPIARQRNFGWRVRPLSESCGWLLRPERIPAPPTRSASLRRSRRPSARRAA